MDHYILRLYVTGESLRSRRAIDNVERICAEDLNGQCELTIIDILQHPDQADKAHILATPTLIKEAPTPLRRLIGDLSEKESVLLGLDLQRGTGNDHAERP